MMKDPSDLSKGRTDAAVSQKVSVPRNTGQTSVSRNTGQTDCSFEQRAEEFQSMGLNGLREAAASKVFTWKVNNDDMSNTEDTDVPEGSDHESDTSTGIDSSGP